MLPDIFQLHSQGSAAARQAILIITAVSGARGRLQPLNSSAAGVHCIQAQQAARQQEILWELGVVAQAGELLVVQIQKADLQPTVEGKQRAREAS